MTDPDPETLPDAAPSEPEHGELVDRGRAVGEAATARATPSRRRPR